MDLTQHSTLNKIFAGFVFVFSFILYVLTLSPTASFWDPGEFIAVANGLQVTHPPGAPLYLILGRIVSMFASPENVAYWVNILSALASAFTIMFLYLIVIRLVREFKGELDSYTLSDKIGMYGGALLAALTFSVSDTFWFNAVEAEVYAISMFFTSIVVWLAHKWGEHHDEPGNEKWLILISYMFGLALGVHLLNLLAIFYVALIVYFKKSELSIVSFLIMGVIAVVSFLSIYPFTVIQIPSIAGSIEQYTSFLIGPKTFIVLLIGLIFGGIYYTHRTKRRIANIVLICFATIMIGYSSYALVLIRSIADPPIDENDPETVESFISYVKRDQYGQTPILKGNSYNNEKGGIDREKEVFFPRRWSSSDGRHTQKYAEYSSDWDYFLSYQVNHMYFRYFMWNFAGRVSDVQDTGWQAGFGESEYDNNPAHNSYFYLPFLLGLFGIYFHVKKDPKHAFSVFALFIMTGLAIIVFLNQYPFQPRERDYAYVGSFFTFAIWIGIGFTGLMELIKAGLKENRPVMYALTGVLFIALPGNMLVQNYDDHDRSERYVAPDYAYNLLNSVEPYGIIFTNGDNDTFPLWYIQEVEKVRTDVRVVCLSLLNTSWYINQLKNQWSHEAPPVPISLSDDEIKNIEDKFSFRKASDFYTPKTHVIPVDKELLAEYHSPNPDLEQELAKGSAEKNLSYEIKTEKMSYPFPIEELDESMSFYYKGNFLGKDRSGEELYYTRVQDDLVMDIIKTNQWVRPVYFAITVSRDAQLNMQNYFYLEGQAFRIIPKKHSDSFAKIIPEIHGERLKNFRFRGLNNPDAYFDENIRRMVGSYRELISSQAEEINSMGMPDSAAKWLSWSEDIIPFLEYEYDPTVKPRFAYKYAQFKDTENALRLAEESEEGLMESLESDMMTIDDIESRLNALQGEYQSARKSADLKTARKLQTQIEQLMDVRENLIQDLYYSASRVFLIQRVYFLSDQSEKAVELANEANLITQNRLGFPTNEKDNREQLRRFGL